MPCGMISNADEICLPFPKSGKQPCKMLKQLWHESRKSYINVLMTQCKTVAYPMLMQWRYQFALNHYWTSQTLLPLISLNGRWNISFTEESIQHKISEELERSSCHFDIFSSASSLTPSHPTVHIYCKTHTLMSSTKSLLHVSYLCVLYTSINGIKTLHWINP